VDLRLKSNILYGYFCPKLKIPLVGNLLFLSSIDTGQLEGHLKDCIVILPEGHTQHNCYSSCIFPVEALLCQRTSLDLQNPHPVVSRAAIP